MAKITSEKLQQTLDRELETFKLKNKMYGNSFEQSLDKYGLIAGLTRISDKFNRLENLILSKSDGTSDERLEDTLVDLANYCNMLAIYVSSGKTESETNDPNLDYCYGAPDSSFGSSEILVGAIRQSTAGGTM